MTQAIVARYASSVTLGTAITLSLLLLMQHLIATGESPFVSSTVYRLVPFARGLEGYVIVQFTITALGIVADVIVTDSSNALFERYAIDAAYKFKYKPRVIDGEPVESRGMLNKFTFVLED